MNLNSLPRWLKKQRTRFSGSGGPSLNVLLIACTSQSRIAALALISYASLHQLRKRSINSTLHLCKSSEERKAWSSVEDIMRGPLGCSSAWSPLQGRDVREVPSTHKQSGGASREALLVSAYHRGKGTQSNVLGWRSNTKKRKYCFHTM